ncbi:hypothetical protein VTK56DRAFT_6575 [Thermocarpiscus australiensis]
MAVVSRPFDEGGFRRTPLRPHSARKGARLSRSQLGVGSSCVSFGPVTLLQHRRVPKLGDRGCGRYVWPTWNTDQRADKKCSRGDKAVVYGESPAAPPLISGARNNVMHQVHALAKVCQHAGKGANDTHQGRQAQVATRCFSRCRPSHSQPVPMSPSLLPSADVPASYTLYHLTHSLLLLHCCLPSLQILLFVRYPHHQVVLPAVFLISDLRFHK